MFHLFSALEKIILNGYTALGLMYFFTSGEDEVKAWTIQVNFKNIFVVYMLLKQIMRDDDG